MNSPKENVNVYIGYMLGWVIGNANVYDNELFFFIKNCNKDVIMKLYKLFLYIYNFRSDELFYSMSQNNDFYLKVKNTNVINDIKAIFDLKEKSLNGSYLKNDIKYSNVPRDILPYFVRGIFDSTGFCYKKDNTVYCGIRLFSKSFLSHLMSDINLNQPILYNVKFKNYYFAITDSNALDFLDIIYTPYYKLEINLYLNRKYDFYKSLKEWNPSIDKEYPLYFQYYKTHDNAVEPYKSCYSNSGYYLTLIHKENVLKNSYNIEFYNTGLVLQPMIGFYFEIVINLDDIFKFGYMLANNSIIIDANCRKNIIVPLIKVDHSKPDLELPCSLVQMIPREIYNLKAIESSTKYDLPDDIL